MSDADLLEGIILFCVGLFYGGLFISTNKATKETAKNTKEMLKILESVDSKTSNPAVGEFLSKVNSKKDEPLQRRERSWHKKESSETDS